MSGRSVKMVAGAWGWAQFALALILGVLIAELLVHHRSGKMLSEDRARVAPVFALLDTEGRKFELDDLRGKVVVVNFWATWCGPCLQEIPELVRVHTEHRKGCFEMLAVAEESGSREEIAAAVKRVGISYPVLIDEAGTVRDAFGVQAYPRTVLIDAHGKLRATFDGAIEHAELERALAPLLAEAGASCPRA